MAVSASLRRPFVPMNSKNATLHPVARPMVEDISQVFDF